jgi:hypothetical protein
MNQTIAYETTRCTGSDTATDPDPGPDPDSDTATNRTAANVLNQIAFTFRVDELINRRITSARGKRRAFGSADHS